MILLAGCAQQVLRPGINDATIRLLARRGVDVVVAAGAGCCGALTYHLGDEAAAIAYAKRNVDAWSKELGQGSGRRHHRQRVGLRHDGQGLRPPVAARAGICRARCARLRACANDISEFVGELRAGRAQALVVDPRRLSRCLLAAAWPEHQGRAARSAASKRDSACADVPEGHICCGSAGTYNILQPELADAAARPQGRRTSRASSQTSSPPATSAASRSLPARSTCRSCIRSELLDWAYGGPVPRGLEAARPLHVQRAGAQAPRGRLHRGLSGVRTRRPQFPRGAARAAGPAPPAPPPLQAAGKCSAHRAASRRPHPPEWSRPGRGRASPADRA